MKKYVKIFAALQCLFVLISCDPIIWFDVDGKKTYKVSSDCGILDISAGRLISSCRIILKPVTIIGKIEIYPDSLQFCLISDNINDRINYYSEYKGNTITSKIEMCDKASLSVWFEPNAHLSSKINIYILPCSYIKCNDKPLITDTIKIILK
jgi:hypothetical protein